MKLVGGLAVAGSTLGQSEWSVCGRLGNVKW